jgi:D-3-phosphoglycerate dehydrogenase
MDQQHSFPKEKINILLVEGVHPAAVELFKSHGYTSIEILKSSLSPEELGRKIKNVHILGSRSKTKVNSGVFSQAEKLIAHGVFSIGTNQVDLKAATAMGVAIFNAPFSNTRSVAEMVIGLAVILMRRIPEKNVAAHGGIWDKGSSGCHEARGKTLGIVGYGHIGSQVSVLAEALGMKVIYHDLEPRLAMGNAVKSASLEALLKVSDVVTLHIPGGAGKLIDAGRLKKMKKGSVLINLSRGDIVDLRALREALESEHLLGAGIDVFENEPQSDVDPFVNELQGIPNVMLTPHIGGSTEEAQESIGLDVAGKLISFLETGSSTGSLSVPSLSLPVQTDAHRLLHIHRNVPGVLSEINGTLGNLKVNILGQYLKTNNDIGYVVLDVDKKTSARAMIELKTVKETIKVRQLY